MAKIKNKEPEQVSQLIGDVLPGPVRPRKPSTYDMLKQSNPEHHLIVNYDKALKEFDDYWESKRLEALQHKVDEPQAVPFKKLQPVDILSVYKLFLIKYYEVTGDVFDKEANDGEGKLLAYTLLYYMFRDERFLNSPLINTEINHPDMRKGIMVIGSYGCGKTSIFKAIRQMFYDAEKNPDIMVKDVDGDDVSLRRYRRLFGVFTANEVVDMYEACNNGDEKEKFWKIFSKGEIYFDDLMTERIASNYGKVELFKDIIEKRYDKALRTLISLNYDGNTNETLTAIGKRYGARVYDRLFHMFNIVELKGRSLRK